MKRLICLAAVFCLLLSGCAVPSMEDIYNAAAPTSDTWQSYFNAGMSRMEEDAYEEAIEAFSDAIREDPGRSDAYIQRGDAYLRLSEQLAEPYIPDEANEAVQPETETAVASIPTPEREEIVNNLDKALDDFDKGQELEPERREEVAPRFRKLPGVLRELLQKYLSVKYKEVTGEEADTLVEEAVEDDSLAYAREMASIISQLDYSMIVSVLQEMGAVYTSWDVYDMDGDDYPELVLDFDAPDITCINSYNTKMVVDGVTQKAEYCTADGAAYVPFLKMDEGGTAYLELWDYSGSNSDCVRYRWDGVQLTEAAEAAPEFDLFLANPDICCHTAACGFNAACAALESAYMGRDQFQGYVIADFDGDGSDEWVFLLLGPTNYYFQRMSALHSTGDELFSNGYFDFQLTAVVVSAQGDETSIRMARLDTNTCTEATADGDCLVVDGIRYTYQSEGTPFGIGEWVVADNIVDTSIFQIALPDAWASGTTWYIDEAADSEGATREFLISFYETEAYEASWQGHLFTLVATLEAEVPYPDADYIGILYLGSPADAWCPIYNVYAVYPTDVQYTSETCDAYIALAADIPTILRGLEAQDGCYFQSYYNN